MDIGLVARCGVVCAAGVEPGTRKPRPTTDAYLVCGEGRAVWLDSDGERSAAADGIGWLVGVVGGDAPTDARARSAAAALARVVVRLFQPTPARDPTGVLVRYLVAAHTRMHWTARSENEADVGASLAVGWLAPGGLAWVEVGSARIWRLRAGVMERLSTSWPLGERQRLIMGSRGLGDDTAIHLQPGRNSGLVPVEPGDRFVLTTGGLVDAVDLATLGGTLRHVSDPQVAAVTCLERSRARGSEAPVSVVVVDIGGAPALGAPPSPVVIEEREEDESTESTVWTAKIIPGVKKRS
jgi:serine/threonine protein phosphatase PrpC